MKFLRLNVIALAKLSDAHKYFQTIVSKLRVHDERKFRTSVANARQRLHDEMSVTRANQIKIDLSTN